MQIYMKRCKQSQLYTIVYSTNIYRNMHIYIDQSTVFLPIPDTIYTLCIHRATYTPRIPTWGNARSSAAVFLVLALASSYMVYGDKAFRLSNHHLIDI